LRCGAMKCAPLKSTRPIRSGSGLYQAAI